MSSEVVNLRRARKARARDRATEAAAANRARFGQTKVTRDATAHAAERLRRTVDGARLGSDEDPLA